MRHCRHPLRITTSLLPLAAAAVVAAILVATPAPAQVFHARGSNDAGAARAGTNEFGIRVGSVGGLRPGGDVTVAVRYSNPFPHGLVVKAQDIEVTSPIRACPAATVDLTAARTALARSLVVPAKGAKTVDVVLSMHATAPDGCQGVRFTTTIRAQGRKP